MTANFLKSAKASWRSSTLLSILFWQRSWVGNEQPRQRRVFILYESGSSCKDAGPRRGLIADNRRVDCFEKKENKVDLWIYS
jgi:hypothetical protein